MYSGAWLDIFKGGCYSKLIDKIIHMKLIALRIFKFFTFILL
jgi:hypothetical protein